MEVFDFNIHLYSKVGAIEEQILSDTELQASDLIKSFTKNEADFKRAGLVAGNFHLFNTDILDDPKLPLFFQQVLSSMPSSSFTLLTDFRRGNLEEYVQQAHKRGFSFVKFHCYVQSIDESEFDQVVACARIAESLGMGICIDTSYGTTGLYKYDNMKLSAKVADAVKYVPIVLLHSGGARVMEAYLIADLCPNVYLETSLSIHFYEGSSVYNDLAFAYRKLGFDRILYASDFPYQKVDEALYTFERFCATTGIDDYDKEQMQRVTAKKLLSLLSKRV